MSSVAALAELNFIVQNRIWTTRLPFASIAYCVSQPLFGMVHWLAFAAVVGVSRDRNPYGLGLKNARQPVWREGITNVECNPGELLSDSETNEGSQSDDEGTRTSGRRSQWRMNDNSSGSDEGDEGDFPIDERDDMVLDGGNEGDGEENGSVHNLNDIIDIVPSPSTARHRTLSQSHSHRSFIRSRRSFYRASSSSPEDPNLSPVTDSHKPGYGTFRSLGGI